ncbi:EAL domain-containing protein [Hydrogenimonas sp.]
MKRVNGIYALFLASIFLSIGYLYHKLDAMQQEVSDNIRALFIDEAKTFTDNIETYLRTYVDPEHPVTYLKADATSRSRTEEALSLVNTRTFQYNYIVYRDDEGRYRYLVDGSLEEKGEYGEWIQVDTRRWDPIYESGRPAIITESNLDMLWGTYLHPIREENRTAGMIVIDFSTQLPHQILSAEAPIKNIFLYIFASIGVFILLLLWQSILLYKSRMRSIVDPLTQAYNRNYLRDFIERLTPEKYHLLMLDLDHFKAINDRYGHRVGDWVLREFADRVRQTIRGNDIFIRYGGEEFLVFVHREDGTRAIRKIAERIRAAIAAHPFHYGGEPLHVTASAGIVVKPEHYKSPSDAIKKADEMLYLAKRTGRNKVVVDLDVGENTTLQPGSALTLDEIKHAVEEKRIVSYFQPIYRLEDRKVVKYEALVRLVDTEGRVHPPGSFLPIVTHTTLYNDITKRLIAQVLKKLHASDCTISVNLNLSDLLDNRIFDILIEQLQSNRSVANRLVVELLENESFQSDDLQRRLKAIRSYGTKIALDDFGSGFANFSLFKDLNIDILKIDGSLIKEIATSANSYKIVVSIQEFAARLQLETIAEFIHDEATLRKVKEAGIRYGQGFFLSKPLPYLKECVKNGYNNGKKDEA